jgi:16S rRNA (cytosine967-C5)-methyltransferase
MYTSSRAYAHHVLLNWFSGEAYLEHVMDFSGTHLQAQDRRFAEGLVHRVILHKRMLEYVLSRFYRKKPQKKIYVILLMGAAEILYMQVPDHAALHSAVELARNVEARAAGFVNAVLRRVLDLRDREWEDLRRDPRIGPGIRYGFPDWLIARWIRQFGSETPELLAALNERPAKMARIVKRDSREEILGVLKQLEILEAESPYHPDFVSLRSWQPLLEHPLFTEGAVIAQDVSAVFPVLLIAGDDPKRVTDVCCAPGGKLTALHHYCPAGTEVRGFDINGERLEDTRNTLHRLGITDLPLQIADAAREKIPASSHILADVPCSGFGVIRKRSDLRWRRRPEEMPQLLQLQKNILDNLSQYLEPGGLLVYSTCTFDREENMGNVRDFLGRHRDFDIAPADPARIPAELITREGAVATFPHRHFCEGSFAIALRKH